MVPQTKRFKVIPDELTQERQLSGLFSVISNNLLVAMEVLNGNCNVEAREDLENLSKKAKNLSSELNTASANLTDDELSSRVSSLKHRILQLIIDLSDDLSKQMSKGDDGQKKVQNVIVARRLLRDARRGLATIRD